MNLGSIQWKRERKKERSSVQQRHNWHHKPLDIYSVKMAYYFKGKKMVPILLKMLWAIWQSVLLAENKWGSLTLEEEIGNNSFKKHCNKFSDILPQ